jgi:hypothetical protein
MVTKDKGDIERQAGTTSASAGRGVGIIKYSLDEAIVKPSFIPPPPPYKVRDLGEC